MRIDNSWGPETHQNVRQQFLDFGCHFVDCWSSLVLFEIPFLPRCCLRQTYLSSWPRE